MEILALRWPFSEMRQPIMISSYYNQSWETNFRVILISVTVLFFVEHLDNLAEMGPTWPILFLFYYDHTPICRMMCSEMKFLKWVQQIQLMPGIFSFISPCYIFHPLHVPNSLKQLNFSLSKMCGKVFNPLFYSIFQDNETSDKIWAILYM